MLLRRLSPGTLTARPTAHLSQQIHGTAPCLYRGAGLRHGYRKQQQQQHVSGNYSNYTPTGQYPHYDMYAQPPRSPRDSRFKDMAIGSGLTILAYIAYNAYRFWQVLKEEKDEERMAKEVRETARRYNYLIKAADDGSEEGTEKARALFRERTFSVARALMPDEMKAGPFTDLGPLPMLPEDHDCPCQEAQSIEDCQTLMLMPPQVNGERERPKKTEEVKVKRGGTEWPVVINNHLVLGVDIFSGPLVVPNRPGSATAPYQSRFNELLCRSQFMLQKLREEGTIEGATFVTVILRDTVFAFISDGKRIGLVGDHPIFIEGGIWAERSMPV
ncbi:hypothetical protein F5Y03DRAFT_188262 [Xylaria venustula]|nr:hypothetical protein F5Y03DRAFT_188262 [Xylaria venustula]